jgi:metacaspase-1
VAFLSLGQMKKIQEKSMYKGMSIHIGVNKLNPFHYGVDGELKGCENDAIYMKKLARSMGFAEEAVTLLLGSDNRANLDDVTTAITNAKTNLDNDGILLITYSGHGSQIIDVGGGYDRESDGFDETWCLYDGMLLDDEIFLLLCGFKSTQRVVIFSDSCHSGTVPESANIDELLHHEIHLEPTFLIPVPIIQLNNHESIEKYRTVRPIALDNLVFNANRYKYRDRQKRVKEQLNTINLNNHSNVDFRELLTASVILISACQDWQLAGEVEVVDTAGNNKHFGIFTNAVKELLEKDISENGVDNRINYIKLHQAVWENIKSQSLKQSPNYTKTGTPNADFEMQPWFTI